MVSVSLGKMIGRRGHAVEVAAGHKRGQPPDQPLEAVAVVRLQWHGLGLVGNSHGSGFNPISPS
jgi:hypothetical protein